jgi:histidinol dehydrogenase
VATSTTAAIALANIAAPEHLVVETDTALARVRNAGAVFVGPWTAQVAGDYAIGSNHVLPTAGAARFRGGLSAADFVKLVSVQRVSKRGLRRLAGTITALARAEGLEGHARSIDIRVNGRSGLRPRPSRPRSAKPSSPRALQPARPPRRKR